MSNVAQQEELKKRIALGVFGVAFLGIGIYVYESFFATNTPVPTATAVITTKGADDAKPTAAGGSTSSAGGNAQAVGLGVAPGVAAKKMASTSSSLDPTLDETAMLRTESLVYSGTGRNIFSLTYVAPVVELPKKLPPARPVDVGPIAPPTPPPYVPPAINLKFFGIEVHADGLKQAFLSHGDDIYLASKGDIVARIYKILDITDRNIQVEDLQNHNTQTLPLLQN
jgi:hypothetical protein